MKQDRLAGLMQVEIDTSRTLIEKEGMEVMNHFVGESSEGSYYVMAPWQNDEERAAALASIRSMFREKKVERYLHTAEAWLGKDPDTMPSKDPARQECLVIAGVDKASGVKAIRIFPIERFADGSRRLGKEQDMGEAAELGGDSLGILDLNPALN